MGRPEVQVLAPAQDTSHPLAERIARRQTGLLLIGPCSLDAAEQWEPYDARVSRTVLRERGGAIPPRHSPQHLCSQPSCRRTGHGLGEPVLDQQAAAQGQQAKSAVARPEERKFLGFSISNDGSERRIAPKALDTFKGRVRDRTRRTRGFGLQQSIQELKPYIVGWRGYFGFCQTPRVLTNLEAWIRRRLRLYLWRQWRTRQNRFAELRRRGVAKFPAAVAAGSPTGSGACQDTRRSNKPSATPISSRSVFPESMRPPKPNSVEPPWYGTRMPGGVGGVASRGVPLSRSIPQIRLRAELCRLTGVDVGRPLEYVPRAFGRP